jgi:hypothetical protein
LDRVPVVGGRGRVVHLLGEVVDHRLLTHMAPLHPVAWFCHARSFPVPSLGRVFAVKDFLPLCRRHIDFVLQLAHAVPVLLGKRLIALDVELDQPVSDMSGKRAFLRVNMAGPPYRLVLRFQTLHS